MSVFELQCNAWFTEVDGTPCTEAVDLTFRYDTAQPYEAAVIFADPDGWLEPVTWRFGRDLLDFTSSTAPRGVGDVRTSVQGPWALLRLIPGPQTCLVRFPRETALVYVARSYALVPPGFEAQHLDLDGALRKLLSDEPPGYVARHVHPEDER